MPFDFVEKKLEEGEDMLMTTMDGGIMRFWFLLIPIVATVRAFFTLALPTASALVD